MSALRVTKDLKIEIDIATLAEAMTLEDKQSMVKHLCMDREFFKAAVTALASPAYTDIYGDESWFNPVTVTEWRVLLLDLMRDVEREAIKVLLDEVASEKDYHNYYMSKMVWYETGRYKDPEKHPEPKRPTYRESAKDETAEDLRARIATEVAALLKANPTEVQS